MKYVIIGNQIMKEEDGKYDTISLEKEQELAVQIMQRIKTDVIPPEVMNKPGYEIIDMYLKGNEGYITVAKETSGGKSYGFIKTK